MKIKEILELIADVNPNEISDQISEQCRELEAEARLKELTMDNEELKKKIIDVLRDNCEYELRYYSDDNYTEVVIDCEAIADALIAAGIGEVKEAEIERKAYEVASNQYRIWFEEQQDRAEVAERALMTVCTNVIKDEEDDIAVEPLARVLYKAYLKQAEKELADEGVRYE